MAQVIYRIKQTAKPLAVLEDQNEIFPEFELVFATNARVMKLGNGVEPFNTLINLLAGTGGGGGDVTEEMLDDAVAALTALIAGKADDDDDRLEDARQIKDGTWGSITVDDEGGVTFNTGSVILDHMLSMTVESTGAGVVMARLLGDGNGAPMHKEATAWLKTVAVATAANSSVNQAFGAALFDAINTIAASTFRTKANTRKLLWNDADFTAAAPLQAVAGGSSREVQSAEALDVSPAVDTFINPDPDEVSVVTSQILAASLRQRNVGVDTGGSISVGTGTAGADVMSIDFSKGLCWFVQELTHTLQWNPTMWDSIPIDKKGIVIVRAHASTPRSQTFPGGNLKTGVSSDSPFNIAGDRIFVLGWMGTAANATIKGERTLDYIGRRT